MRVTVLLTLTFWRGGGLSRRLSVRVRARFWFLLRPKGRTCLMAPLIPVVFLMNVTVLPKLTRRSSPGRFRWRLTLLLLWRKTFRLNNRGRTRVTVLLFQSRGPWRTLKPFRRVIRKWRQRFIPVIPSRPVLLFVRLPTVTKLLLILSMVVLTLFVLLMIKLLVILITRRVIFGIIGSS